MSKEKKERLLQPTDIICMLALVLLTVMFVITRDPDIKSALLGLIVFLGGRQSKRTSNGD